jgi:hypothetical protein
MSHRVVKAVKDWGINECLKNFDWETALIMTTLKIEKVIILG